MSNVTPFGFPRSTFVKVVGLTPEGKQPLPKFPAVVAWANRTDASPSVVRFNAKLPPRAPIPHAREWVHRHRAAS